jgi:hypothetical protein
MRSGWLRLTVVIGVAALALVAFGTAMAAAGSSSGLAAVVSGWTGGREIAPPRADPQQGQAGTSIEADKTAEGFWTRIITYDWSLTKSVSPDSLTLARGESGEVTYTIAATRQKVGEHESAGVRGTICVTNTGGVATEGLAITDVVEYKKPPAVTDFTPFLTVTVDVSEKPVLGPGESHCYDYEIPFTPLEGVTQYRNHAIVTITNHSGHLGEPFGPEPKAGFSLPDSPTVVEVDESASVSDEEHCPAGFTCAPSETGPWTFHDSGSVSFHKTITNETACDATTELHNVATLTEGDTHETRTAEAVVHLTAPPCPVGCVLTQGFWKTHPNAWPEGHSPNDPFFSSGKTWLEVLWTAPRGDAYYILAHQYIAAVLNVANGATPPAEVSAVIDAATAWFGSHGPGVPASSPEGQTLIHWAEVLTAFNEGMMGVPHCENVEAGPATLPKKGLGRPETPPGLEKRPEMPPGLENRPENKPNQEQRPETPPGQEKRPETPPGQEKGKGK